MRTSVDDAQPLTAFMMGLAGFCILGLQFGLNAASATIYPTSIRSNGSGWAFGMGRFGSILGPILGCILIELKVGAAALFLLAAIPYVLGTAACLLMSHFYFQQFRGTGFGQRQAASEVVANAA